ncbi:MAG: hypothetical protein ABSE93_11720 [Terriglobia bacterium]|jgi:hypothetical protein
MHFKLGKSGRAVMVGLACWLLPLWSVRAQSPPSNISALKAEMKVFEAVIDGTMAQTFAPPFGLLEKTQGTYLPGFGLAFSLEVNLYPLRAPNPFNLTPLSKAELDTAQKAKLERITTIKESVPRLLADHAMSLRDLSSDDSIAVVVHLFEVQSGDTKFPDQLVIKTRKSDLDQFWDKKISYQQLTAKMTILEF